MNEIRLQLALAKAGLASRRHAEELIVAGRVAVNGKIVSQLGSRIDPVSDRVTVDGNPVLREAPAYYLMNKPKGYVTTAEDPEGRPTVFSLLKGMAVRLFSVGRLDYNTEGALLLTNDGELAHALMHPSRGVAKVYHAKFRGVVSKEQVTMLRRGVELPPARPLDKTGKPLPTMPGSSKVERSAPAEVIPVTSTGRHTWLQFILHEGKNRQIHRMAEAVGSSLLKLLRVEYAGLTLGELAVGEYRPLQSREVLELRQSVGLRPFAAKEGPLKPRAKPEPPADPAQESRSRTGGRAGREESPARPWPLPSGPRRSPGGPDRDRPAAGPRGAAASRPRRPEWSEDRERPSFGAGSERPAPGSRGAAASRPRPTEWNQNGPPRPRSAFGESPDRPTRGAAPTRPRPTEWSQDRSPRARSPFSENQDRPAGGARDGAPARPRRPEWSQDRPPRERPSFGESPERSAAGPRSVVRSGPASERPQRSQWSQDRPPRRESGPARERFPASPSSRPSPRPHRAPPTSRADSRDLPHDWPPR